MKNKYLIVSLVLVLFAAVVLNARPGRRDMGAVRGRHALGMLANENFVPVRLLLEAKDKIGLSSEQEKRLRTMSESHQQWLIQSRADMELRVLKLRNTLAAEPLNMKDAEALIREQANMRAEMQITLLRQQQEIKSVLSAEQLNKLGQLKKEFRAQRREKTSQRLEQRRERLN